MMITTMPYSLDVLFLSQTYNFIPPWSNQTTTRFATCLATYPHNPMYEQHENSCQTRRVISISQKFLQVL